MTRGAVPPNPSELLMHPRFAQLIDEVSRQYDLVLIDTPPVLAVTDPSVIGRLAGTTLMVGRFGQNTIKEIEAAANRFHKSGIVVKGVILNAVEKKSASNIGYYEYAYK
jgi:tyrosine-protein kinase Etk/Wzc